MSRLDSLYKKIQPDIIESKPLKIKKPRRVAFPLYYFYQSLRVVLVMWILMLVVVIVAPWANYFVKSRINNQNQQVLGAQTPVESPIIKPKTIPVLSPPTFSLKKGDLEIKAPIIEGITEEDLTKGLGHHPDSVWPNVKGNAVIAGHSFSLDAENKYGQVFANLRDVEIGDQVSVTYQNKKYTYKVFKKETTPAKDMSLMGKADAWQLTFYTCDPPKTDWRRLVFQAELVKIE